MTEDDEPHDETVTRGGYVLPPPVPHGQFAGPSDDPDRYELIGDGIAGGEGTTWRARYHGRLQAPLPLAVKRLQSQADPDGVSEDDRRRWQDRATLLRHLRLDHVVRVHEVFFGPPPHEAGEGCVEQTSSAYLVMEWVEGPTLRELCRNRPASRATIKSLMRHVEQAAVALNELSSHTRSAGNPSLHRDIKPSNCIVNDERGLVLIDVSTLRLVDDGFDPAGWHTPPYTAPEVLAAPHLPRSPAADVFSLGALAMYCLTGRDPVSGSQRRSVLEAAARGAGVANPSALAAHVEAAMDPDPARRPDDLAHWGRRLTELATPAVRPLVYMLSAASALLLAAGFLLIGPPDLLRRADAEAPPTAPAATIPSASAATIPAGYAGAIRTPPDGSQVKQCAYFEGTATLPGGRTLILGMRNLTNGDPERYAEAVFGFDSPRQLANWRGAQYFGQGNQTVGQQYEVQLLAVPLSAVRAWRNDADDQSGSSLAAGGLVLDTVRLQRAEGLVANDCEGP